MTRTNKWTVHERKSQPKWFTHHGPINSDPTKVKKGGAGKNNWGTPGDELDSDDYNFFGASKRRNSNHMENEEH
ncbi:uncharacterized protein CANTADRAFT_89313 [Suhomyces tanzawaensis NRRL Y-17324]|uniref:Hyaluronan/mRNA-binding protein domain-containing protein n=1 Tax=Suhomyces tanzawaensis NRRL Y-17324 TaxID=984487 RepID=A0A1E4SJI7_9ASCO|nr:uncharacterized protein CANTADRAFT_89313 [Suhomyces tanzawaensis NRRL Y-17324]ODV79671.1 hypothetical protein CANTADRAFT_89313 [Suhomyces tanzawaensis NRRL Y-17324]